MKIIAAFALVLAFTPHLPAKSPRIIKCTDLACCMENPPSETNCCTPGHVCPVN